MTIEGRQRQREYDRLRWRNPKHRREEQAYMKKYRAQPHIKEQRRLFMAERRKKCRNLALDHYGAVRVCCGERRRWLLTFDHINGGGARHMQQVGDKHLGVWLVRSNFPVGFQVLCRRCNASKGEGKCCTLKHREAGK